MRKLQIRTKDSFDKAIQLMNGLSKKTGLPVDFDIVSMAHVSFLDYALYIISSSGKVCQADCDLLKAVFDFSAETEDIVEYMEKDLAHKELGNKVSQIFVLTNQVDKMTSKEKQNAKNIKIAYESIGGAFVEILDDNDCRKNAHEAYIRMLEAYMA